LVKMLALLPINHQRLINQSSMKTKVFEMEAQVLKALAQPTRLKILECLRKGERSIYEIIPYIHAEQSNVSRHISLMHKNDIVTTRKDGVKVMVKVKDTEIFNILDRVSKILKDRFKEQEKLLLEI